MAYTRHEERTRTATEVIVRRLEAAQALHHTFVDSSNRSTCLSSTTETVPVQSLMLSTTATCQYDALLSLLDAIVFSKKIENIVSADLDLRPEMSLMPPNSAAMRPTSPIWSEIIERISPPVVDVSGPGLM